LLLREANSPMSDQLEDRARDTSDRLIRPVVTSMSFPDADANTTNARRYRVVDFPWPRRTIRWRRWPSASVSLRTRFDVVALLDQT
jgi:hypothetical protein